jgi:hypothetical protein
MNAMSKARAAGILGALVLCGLLVLSSLAVAGGDPFFAMVKDAFQRACSEQATDPEACLFVVRALPILAQLLDAFKETLGLQAGMTCDECVQVVQDFEIILAANGTVQDIADALAVGCGERFRDPARADECRQRVDALTISAPIDVFLGNFPPLTACRALKFCPLP